MTKITTNQYILIAVFCILTSKIMTMPNIVFEYAQKDAVFSVLLNTLFDVLLVVLITILIKKYPNSTFFEVLKQKFGKIIAVVILSAVSVFLVFKGAFLLQETLSFFTLALYEQVNFWLLFIPAILTIIYISYKGLSAIGRSIDIYWIFVFLALLIILTISVMKVDFNANLPYFENGIGPMLLGSMHSLLYTGNPLLLLFFVGKVQQKPKIVAYTSLFAFGMGVLIVVLNFVFFNLFTSFVPYCTFALSHLSQNNPFVTELGHIGWLSIVESTINLVFMCSICCYCTRQYIQAVFLVNKKIVSSCVAGVLLLCILWMFGFNLYNLINFAKNYGFYYNLVLLPTILLVCIVLCIPHKKQQKTQQFLQGGVHEKA